MRMSVEGYTTFHCQDIKWVIREDVLPPVKERLIPHLSSHTFFKQNVPIKKGKRKSIWHLTLTGVQVDETYIIKRYLSKHPLARLKNFLKLSKAARELKAAVLIARKGIPTTLPVAMGEKGGCGFVKESFVVLEKLKECRDLNSYFLEEYPAIRSSQELLEKWKIIKELGILASRVLQEGVLQSDFSLNNFLLTKDKREGIKLYLTDFEKITIKKTLSFNQKLRCLAKLNRVGREISTANRLRFLKSYMGSTASWQQIASLARTIQESTIELLKQDHSRGRITSVYTDALYEKYEQEYIKGYCRKGYKIDEILGIIHKFDLLARSLPTSDMKQKEEINIELSCNSHLKPFKVVRYTNPVKNISARSLWIKMSTLLIAGIPLELPHIFMEMKVKSNQEGYLFIPIRENEMPLGEFIKPSLGEKELLSLIELLVKLMKKLHHFGTFSDKITESNFAVVEKTVGGPSIYLKNIETFNMKKEIALSEKKRDLAILNGLIKKHYPTMTFDLTQRYFKN